MLLLTVSLALSPTVQLFDPMVPITKEVEAASRTLTGDFDGDGRTDLVVVGRQVSGALIRLGDGAGGFGIGQTVDFGIASIRGAAAGDLDGDGVLDLVALSNSYLSDPGVVLIGVGDGTFGGPVALGFGQYDDVFGRPRLVDLDGDGDMDIVVGGDQVFAVQNLGGGIFAPAQVVSDHEAHDVVVFDADGDGDLDIVHAWLSGLVVSQQTGAFQFQDRVALPMAGPGNRIETADLDGDGDLDLVLANSFSDTFQFVENQGGGAFAAVPTTLALPGWTDMEVIDVNRDGQPDILGVADDSNSSFWMENQGGFTFGYQPLPNASEPAARRLGKADLNGDLVDDLLLIRATGEVDLLLSDLALGTVPYGSTSVRLHVVLPKFEDAIAADLDGDGDADIVASTTADGIFVVENIGFTGFRPAQQRVEPIVNGFLGTRDLKAVDLDGDGDQDLLCVSTQGQVTWFENNGAGALQPRALGAAGVAVTGEAYHADVDRDGDLDVLAAGALDAVVWIEQTAPGVFAASNAVVVQVPDLMGIRVADIDLDGIEDIALFTQSQQGLPPRPASLHWSRGNGDGTFQAPLFLLGELEDANQIEFLHLGPAGALRPKNLIWSSLSAPRIDGALASPTPAYVLRQGLGLLNKRAERFAVGGIERTSSEDLVVQEGTGGQLTRASLVVYRGESNTFRRLEVVADDLSALNSIGVYDIDTNGANDILINSEAAPRLSWLSNRKEDVVSTRYCSPAVPNQTGQSARMDAFNGSLSFNQDFVLQASDLPAAATTLFLASQSQGFQPMVPGSIGTLCLGGAIGRFVGVGQVQISSADGAARLTVLRTMMPQPGGLVPALDGSLWFFQAWYRDSQGGGVVSNFTDGLAVRFE